MPETPDPGPGLLGEQLRARLSAREDADTDVFRVCHGRGGTFPGLEDVFLDHYAGTLRLGLHGERDAAWVRALSSELEAATANAAVDGAWLQWRERPGAPVEVLFGTPRPSLQGREDGLTYLLRPGELRNAGLFLDARPARRWLRERARGARVLNLFAYTCAFSLAALAGGAREVVNVDMARSALETGQRNHALNDLRGARFLPHDVWKSRGALRRRGPFDLVVLDPPTFQRGSFEADRDWPRLLRRLGELVRPGGQVLLLVNSPFLTVSRLETWRRELAPGFAVEARLGASTDFPERDPDRGLKVLVWRRSASGPAEDVEGDAAQAVRGA
ncbi:MAG: class I SAM-dependent methyltransferase [Pseudomonadales bacterium]|jgi:23S rRNA (cytosine1962-C5)-methyltransferase|nr:class I SAM-dependent methyltransferase [Pseudomonadales bacterium]